MRLKGKGRPRRRLLKMSCVGAGLLSMSNPTRVTAADIGLYDVHNNVSLGKIANPFPQSQLGVHVAVGDLDGDGFGYIVTGAGKGTNEIFFHKHKTSDKCCRFDAGFLENPAAGVRVATGDLDGDGRAEIIVSPSRPKGSSGDEAGTLKMVSPPGSEPQLELLNSTTGIFGEFTGGVSVAIGDFAADGEVDIVAVTVRGWDPAIKKEIVGKAGFTDYLPKLGATNGGVEIVMGDVDGDGSDEVLARSNDSSDGMARLFMHHHKQKSWIEIQGFAEPIGVHVALGDVDGDGRDDLAVGSPRGVESYIQLYSLEDDSGFPGGLRATPGRKFTKPTQKLDFSGLRVALGDLNSDGYADLVFAQAAIPEPTTIASLLLGLGTWLVGGRRRTREEPLG